jgi:hypothetical protein
MPSSALPAGFIATRSQISEHELGPERLDDQQAEQATDGADLH